MYDPRDLYHIRQACEELHELQVDGDTSTNDTVIALASGLSGAARISNLNGPEASQLQLCLDAV